MGMLLESGQQRATRTGRNSLPANILALMDLEILEICKDSFIEKDLRDYFSNMLYKVNLSGSPAYVYVLATHLSRDTL